MWMGKPTYLDRAVGKAMRLLREKAEISVSEMSDQLHVDHSTIRSLEAGRNTISKRYVKAYADILKITPEAIYDLAYGTKKDPKNEKET